ncbi:HAMP domain-containing protein [Alkalibaculum sp. M08DMB]|uniref:histidine kinase n=1 Tax=Alkalibaculum sporogenes TaxID=2655001 RepID=A0A6A7K8T3_9FIRM|nr:HAMP domain-containing sensor histidine kinase [Alkalibaculum sporogenes]MPW25597.1 HAMP domain-containing protein [Alkalibaculum sporogenes]
MKEKNMILGLGTVRKKVFLLSKLVGGIIILFYMFTQELPVNQNSAFWIWLTLLIIVVTGVDVLLGHFISKPLNSINNTADKMAQLDFSAHCEIKTNDEFGELAHSLNVMFANLQEALKKLEIANTQLKEDVAQERLLLVQRKELVDSLSHEMKTPLGIIRAYTEGLKDETDEEKKQQYMDVILSATERMNGMIVSLLDLSALEAGAIKLSEERFDFIEIVETVAGRLLIDAPSVDYHFSYELPEENFFIRADKYRIEQVLDNLIENAKKHVSDEGEIRLAVTHGKNMLRFSIYNQGKLIPEKDLPKIWMKFYRGAIPQSDSRSGSGLGLAIVAQILSMYKADYGVQNLPKGVEFYFKFPTIT